MGKGDEYLDKMLAASEAGQGPKNLKEQAQMLRGLKKTGPVRTMPPSGDTPSIGKPKDHAPSNISPHGDLGSMSDRERRAMFRRPIKNSGRILDSARALPYRKPAREGGHEGYHSV